MCRVKHREKTPQESQLRLMKISEMKPSFQKPQNTNWLMVEKKQVKKWMKNSKSQSIMQLRFVLGWDGAKSRALGERGLGRAKIY